ncbi:allantoinase (plasmid) [Aminobacter sp. Y103A]|uniref:allantoinase PuuE n=1 Tax=Aminobacter sp. Y103A TaxID=1870862 RepID=UPI00257359BD|nr:allantoinase PuuE [Aminobacter sp. SS-2016]BBD40641.1 allantoinase [Aminobacter sp. SS-2016]
MSYPRDMVGYGNRPPMANWPNGAKLALQFIVAFEEGSENCVLHGDAHSENFISDIIGAPQLFGVRNMNMESLYEYGTRVAFWRVFDEFKQRGIHTTVLANGLALQHYPEAGKIMHSLGHEIASHGWKWIDHQWMGEDTERAQMKLAIDTITRVTGERPVGWYTGRCSPNTLKLVVEEGGFLYDSDTYADDLPYWENVNGKQHLRIPYTLEANDMRFVAAAGFNSGDQYFTYLKDTFDVLYRESDRTPRMMSTGLHLRIVGRPGRWASFLRFLDYVQKHEGVWICRRDEIARHWHKHHAPERQ